MGQFASRWTRRPVWRLPGRTQRLLTLAALGPLVKLLTARNGVAVSVIIATRNRATYLELALASLERQLFPSAHWEVVVADDASDDNTSQVLEEYIVRGRLHLRRHRSEIQRGFSYARNKALESARGAIIVFLREDEIAAPQMLMQHLRHHVSGAVFVIGNTSLSVHSHVFSPMDAELDGVILQRFLSPDDLDVPELWQPFVGEREHNDSALWAYFALQGKEVLFPWVYFTGGNASILRDALIEVGGFNEGRDNWNLGSWGLECRDLALRLERVGVPFRFETNALALRQSKPARRLEARARARNINYFFCSHNEIDPIRVGPMLLR